MAEAPVSSPAARGVLAIGIVFALGAIFGAALSFAVLRLLAAPGPSGWPGPGPGGRRAIARMARDLDLDGEQQERIRAIIARRHGEIREILERSREDVRGVLRPDQQERFDRMRPPRPLLRPGGPGRPPDDPGPPPVP